MQTYDSYKDSGIDWLGEIPSHWEVIKNKFLNKIYNGDSLNDTQKKKYESDDESHLAYISSKDIDVNYSIINYNNGLRIFDCHNFKIAPKNSSLLCIEGGSAGRKIAFTTQDVCFVNKLACFNTYKNYNAKFVYYSLKGKVFQTQFKNSLTGLIGGVSISAINNFVLTLPPLPEQEAIARFLDDKCAKIDELVAIKEQQIDKLKELRQVKIHQAVTKGINPNVEMKDSGIDWIGEIPKHWEVKRFKFLCSINTGSKNTEDKVDDGLYPFYVRSQTAEKINTYSYDGEAILTAGDGAGVGKVYHYVNGKFDYHQRVYKFSDFNNVIGKYLYHFLYSEFYNVAILGTAKSTVDSLRLPLIQDFIVTFPNSKVEQEAIVVYLEEVTGKIDQAIAQREAQIEKLKAYKQSLINEVVTGKVKVC